MKKTIKKIEDEKSAAPCEQCVVLRKELDDFQDLFIGSIAHAEERQWTIAAIWEQRALAAAEKCWRLETENAELRRTINGLRQWN